jgi:ABC-type transporter Mla maintaining outer membrane lipid asymmetry ATPase subunit MlaF
MNDVPARPNGHGEPAIRLEGVSKSFDRRKVLDDVSLDVADELAMLHEGKVIARGTAEELDRSDNELVRTFMRSEGAG